MQMRHVRAARRLFSTQAEALKNKRLQREAREQAEASGPLQSVGSIAFMLAVIGLPAGIIGAIVLYPPKSKFVDDEDGLDEFGMPDDMLAAGGTVCTITIDSPLSKSCAVQITRRHQSSSNKTRLSQSHQPLRRRQGH
jgi:hypothetical protein